MTTNTLSANRLKELLVYDSNTGVFTWKIARGNSGVGKVAGADNEGYVRIAIDRKRYLAHSLAWLYVYGEFHRLFLDHIDGDRKNNAISNLREVSKQQNSHNRGMSVTNTSGYKGVSKRSGQNKWVAHIVHNRKCVHLGYYDTPEEASEFYELVALTLRGEYHRGVSK